MTDSNAQIQYLQRRVQGLLQQILTYSRAGQVAPDILLADYEHSHKKLMQLQG